MPTQDWTSWPTLSSVKKYRVAKYKQRRVLQETGWIKDERLSVGACTGLSYRWISLHKKTPTESATNRTQALKPTSIFQTVAYFADVFNSNDSGLSYKSRIANTAKFSLGGVTTTSSIVSEKDNIGFGTFIQQLDNTSGYYVVFMNLSHSAGSTNHVCAAFQTNSHLIFFDPNSGEYKVKNEQRKHFLQELVRQYKTYVTSSGKKVDVTINEWLVAPVNPF